MLNCNFVYLYVCLFFFLIPLHRVCELIIPLVSSRWSYQVKATLGLLTNSVASHFILFLTVVFVMIDAE